MFICLEDAVANFYECFNCKKLTLSDGSKSERCRLCGSSNGTVVAGQQVSDGLKAGVYHNIDPVTGKPRKERLADPATTQAGLGR